MLLLFCCHVVRKGEGKLANVRPLPLATEGPESGSSWPGGLCYPREGEGAGTQFTLFCPVCSYVMASVAVTAGVVQWLAIRVGVARRK